METTNLATLILFSEDVQLTNYDEEHLVELVVLPYDDQDGDCTCWERYELIG